MKLEKTALNAVGATSNGELTYIPVDQLECLPHHESRIEAFASGRTAGPVELARQLLVEKISGDLTNVYCSMGSGKAAFHPHQFRPVLKYVESTGRRLLIGDEVGVGKTISAIYIWKELQARGDARRLLVICPAALKDKWQYELLNRFSIEAQPVDADTLGKDLEITLRDPLHSFLRIVSLEGLRSRQLDEDDGVRRRVSGSCGNCRTIRRAIFRSLTSSSSMRLTPRFWCESTTVQKDGAFRKSPPRRDAPELTTLDHTSSADVTTANAMPMAAK